MSTGLLYSYFANRSDSMRSLWLRPVAEFGREIDAIVAATPHPNERIEALLSAYVAWAHEHPDAYRGVLLLVRPPTTEKIEQEKLEQLPMHRVLRDDHGPPRIDLVSRTAITCRGDIPAR